MLDQIDLLETVAQSKRKYIGTLCVLILLSLFCIILSLCMGSATIELKEIFSRPLSLFQSKSQSLSVALFQLRLQRTLTAFTTGASLALAGVMMQALLRNPLADPYVLGVSGGASVGALLMLFLGSSALIVQGASFAGAIAISMLLYWFVRKDWQYDNHGNSTSQLLLTGVILAFGCSAIVMLFLSFATDSHLRGMVFWLMGDLEGSEVNIVFVLILIAILLWMSKIARSVNLLALHFQEAFAFGVNVSIVRKSLFIGSALLTACAVSSAGSIGFVGLIIPHVCRMFFSTDHRLLFPVSTLVGGCFLVLADVLARTVASPHQIPIGVITALIGVPVFLFQLYRYRVN